MLFDIPETQMQHRLFFFFLIKKIVPLILLLISNSDIMMGFMSLICNIMLGSTRKCSLPKFLRPL